MKVVITALAILLGGTLVTALVSEGIERAYRMPWFSGLTGDRVHRALKELPKVLDQDHAVVTLGASITAISLDPEEIDRELGAAGWNTRTYNFGFFLTEAVGFSRLAKRIQEQTERSGRKLEAAVLELSPGSYSGVRPDWTIPFTDDVEGALASAPELAELAVSEPHRAPTQAWYRYLLRRGFARLPLLMLDDVWNAKLAKLDEALAPGKRNADVTEIWGELTYAWVDRMGPGYFWHPELQGYLRYNADFVKEPYRQMIVEWHKPASIETNIEWEKVTGCSDVIVDERQLEHVILAIRHLQKSARRVFAFVPPLDRKHITYSPEGRKRLAGVVDRIFNETGVRVAIIDENAFETDDFFDMSHPNQLTGAQKLGRLVAQSMLAEVARQEAAGNGASR